ncbi:TPA: hypothetical protein DIC20_00380 [Candidatus Dependentiae bacterium]|nr:MAG: Beta-lactamase-like protein [candidate division TM6 bacterium GW2011_GWF2_36_131]KKQ03507.1 MAG: Beta-lactamase-like protein [candidate division TM6 bacterium GW2011_GWE2_36_25]KKQ20219.1 MAG: Beta-lactamase-like protein [candidate division TM6 bacterium GW2011_GWA2_36_9]HBR70758.1 hypothetical protein [Candidatus Dependentiae bacterium]HCU00143.1 hypothetical protein [Candidatus Dependentiae bacterium]
MKITFLGTKGYIDSRSRRHFRHTATLITYKNKKIMIDCGIDWAKKVWKIKPDAIVITHAHPDHVWGLKEGSPCPVYATKTSWKSMENYLIREDQRKIIYLSKPNTIFDITFNAIKNEHSLIAPAVSYRISTPQHTIFYSGDVVYIPHVKQALKNAELYIGDAATITQPLVRKKDNHIYGHATIGTQLTWCKKAGVTWAIFTHCGSQIVDHDGRKVAAQIRKLGKQKGIKAKVAYDGMVINL